MIASIRHNLANLLNPKGRDSRAMFWPYFLTLVLVNILLMAAIAIPTFASVLSDLSANASGQPPEVVEAMATQAMLDSKLPTTLVRTSLIIGLFNILLLGTAFIRRCHDAGLPGMVALIPTGLQLVWMYFAYGQLDRVGTIVKDAAVSQSSGEAVVMQPGMIAQDLIGWIAVLVVVLVGLAKSQPGANSYGEAAGLN